ncbi:MAG: aminodeoxychorismate/anthranilate synthase component II [Pseudomonadota bacterium]
MILLIDNYDSFTWNLAHLIAAATAPPTVVRNDAISVEAALDPKWRAIVLSPGPSTPDKAGVCVDVVRAAAEAGRPVFGVCLGLQAIAAAFGGPVRRAGKLMHGKTSRIAHDARDLFAGLPAPFTATRYHSLIADRAALPADLTVSATAQEDGEVMALTHKTRPIAGVQFHPESVASEHGAAIFANFLQWSAP